MVKIADPIETSHEAITTGKVVEYIESRIRSGYMAPGQRLVEADIMQDTGATRGRVREALQRLAIEGLIVIQEFRGASVKRMSRAELDQNYLAREVLEGLCARLMAERGGDEAMAQLRQHQSDMDAYAAAGDNERYTALNERWHELIIKTAGNAYVSAFLHRLRIPIFRVQFRRLFSMKTLRESNLLHGQITAAILAHDGDAAERLMRDHIRSALNDYASGGDEFFER